MAKLRQPIGPARVSVVTATYNRSTVLPFAIRSVQAQTLTDWEHTIVGDHCTDDTADVVGAVDDPRVSWLNLEVRVGDQSGPNNSGIERATGDYIAMLNHDDLWFPDHLEQAVGFLDRTGADLVFPLAVRLRPDGEFMTLELPHGDRYAPFITVPASLWVFRRSLFERVGPWSHFRDIHNIPSQDWLHRAHRLGCDLRLNEVLSVVMVPAGMRPNAYQDLSSSEHQHVEHLLLDATGFRDRLMTEAALRESRGRGDPPILPAVRQALRRVARSVVGRVGRMPVPRHPLRKLRSALAQRRKKLTSSVGIHPLSVRFLFRFRRRGGAIDELRSRTGATTVARSKKGAG